MPSFSFQVICWIPFYLFSYFNYSSLCSDVYCLPNVQSHNVCMLGYCNVLKWPKVQQQSLNMVEWPGCGAPDLRPPPHPPPPPVWHTESRLLSTKSSPHLLTMSGRQRKTQIPQISKDTNTTRSQISNLSQDLRETTQKGASHIQIFLLSIERVCLSTFAVLTLTLTD